VATVHIYDSAESLGSGFHKVAAPSSMYVHVNASGQHVSPLGINGFVNIVEYAAVGIYIVNSTVGYYYRTAVDPASSRY
jgi:hypothetical protein